MERLDYSIRVIENYKEIKESIFYYNEYFMPTLVDLVKDLEGYASKIFKKAISFKITNDINENLGMISFYDNDKINKIAYITIIVVNKKVSNKGIGSILIESAEKYCKNNDMKFMKLEVHKDNLIALKFYKKHGYHIISETRTTYYLIKRL